MEFFTTRQLLLAGSGEEASGSSMLGSLCVLDVSMVGIGLAFGSERETCQYTGCVSEQRSTQRFNTITVHYENTYNSGSICTRGAVRGGVRLFKRRIVIGHHLQQEEPEREAFKSQTVALRQRRTAPFTSASLCRFAVSSSTGECGLLTGAPLMESSRPLGSSLGLLAALGFTSLAAGGGEGGFALTDGSAGGGDAIRFSKGNKGILPVSRTEPATVMGMPCS